MGLGVTLIPPNAACTFGRQEAHQRHRADTQSAALEKGSPCDCIWQLHLLAFKEQDGLKRLPTHEQRNSEEISARRPSCA